MAELQGLGAEALTRPSCDIVLYPPEYCIEPFLYFNKKAKH